MDIHLIPGALISTPAGTLKVLSADRKLIVHKEVCSQTDNKIRSGTIADNIPLVVLTCEELEKN